MSAAIYAARRNLNFVVISKDIGGEVALSGVVNNWPGTIEINGFELAKQFHEHAKSYGVKIEDGVEVKEIKQEKKHHIIVATDKEGKEKIYETKAVLVASGIHPRELGAKRETILRGKGVTYCTVCDGPLFRNKTTATVGAGNSALESALMMAGIAKKVYILTKYADKPETLGGFPKGENILVQKLKSLPNIEVVYGVETKEITGTDFVDGLLYEDIATKTSHELKVDGVMIHIGSIPNSDFVANVNKNKLKEIEVNLRCETNIPGLFAAGDVTNVPFKQIVIASGQGVTAVLSAIEYLNRWAE